MILSKSSKELINELNQLDECDSIEAKEISGNDVGSSVYETICAFSNEPNLGGGIILLGVKRDDSQLFAFCQVSGVENPDKLSSDIVSACQNKYNVLIRPIVKRELIDRKVVIRIEVHEMQPAQKPVYIKNLNLPRGAFRRIGSADVHSSQEDLAAFYQDGFANTFDAHSIPDSRQDDIDPQAIALYRQFVSQFLPSSELLRWSDTELLTGTTCIKQPNPNQELPQLEF
jgi:ATP-dependent DNA helicase RecG